jgi:predicted esterase
MLRRLCANAARRARRREFAAGIATMRASRHSAGQRPEGTVRPLLLALHGYTSHGAAMRTALAPLGLERFADVEYPDAPHLCSPESLERVYPGDSRRPPPPHLNWCRADDQGRVYEGWSATLAMLRARLERARAAGQRAALFGFSQGAMVSATLAALAARAEVPPLQFVVLIAGSVPRALELAPLFHPAVAVRSLHVWGTRDTVTGAFSPLLAERFAASEREIITWRGPHVVPTTGPAAAGIVAFVRQHAT